MESSFSTHPYAMDNVQKTIDFPFSKEEYISQFKALYIGEWDSNYYRFVLDGTQWHLGIYFSNFHDDIEIYGSNAYPYNFNKLCELMGISNFSCQDKEAQNDKHKKISFSRFMLVYATNQNLDIYC